MFHRKRRRVLFILKKSSYSFGSPGYDVNKSGLMNSVRFCSEELTAAHVPNKIVIVQDNNDIDREVHAYRPTDVIIEALWVIPEKFDVLKLKHPRVNWIVRIHSELPFIALEGNSMRWIFGYLERGVRVATNSLRMLADLKSVALYPENLLYLPNCYTEFPSDNERHEGDYQVVNVGCFGSIRPLKNQLLQAVAAIQFADRVDRRLRFHINGTRREQNGESVLKNLIGLFDSLNPHLYRLVTHPWMSRLELTETLKKIDLGLQMSFTETFNITAADMVSRDVPVVVSPEISWVLPMYQADPNQTGDIADKMVLAWRLRKLDIHGLNKVRLRSFARKAARVWRDEFDNHD